MNDKILGIQIKRARLQAGLTQNDLGKKIGVSWEMISRYENGKSSSRQNLELLAKALKKPIQYFFGVEEVPIREAISNLSDLLEKKKKKYEEASTIPYIDNLTAFDLKQSLKLTSQKYACPSWCAKFDNVFVALLDEVESESIAFKIGDVGFFTLKDKENKLKYGLCKKNKVYQIEKIKKGKKYSAYLLAVERKYY